MWAMGRLEACSKVNSSLRNKKQSTTWSTSSFLFDGRGDFPSSRGNKGELESMNLEEMKREIETLVVTKGFYNKPEDIPKKLLFAFIELGEASDAWKKGEAEENIAEELIDVIFYVLDASRLACPTINMDEMFRKKLEKNLSRPFQYGEGHRNK
jgi:NTP pyrophosphatase (non-canonical NTP hydrolase)